MPLKKVFLCHSSSDKLFVDRLASDLEKVNIGVWYDKWEIKVGDSLIDKIQEGLENNNYLAIILSPESVNSEWVRRELNSALMKEIKEKKIVVLPCLLYNCSIPTFLSEKKYADFMDSYENGFTDLLLAIFPESKALAIRSRDFRVIQYLISGLTNTDHHGSNVLNSRQLWKIFPFRKELKGYLGLDEKKLLFYSAVAFKAVNPETPSYINNNVPVWGLLDETDDIVRSQWIIQGTDQTIFGYMAPYFDWCVTVNKSLNYNQIEDSCLNALKSIDPNHPNTISWNLTRTHMLRFFAKHDPRYFMEDYIRSGRINPGIIDATADLSAPMDDGYYLDIYNSDKKPEIVAAAIKTLIKLKRPIAVQLLSKEHKNLSDIVWNHELMNMLRDQAFVPELQKWFEESKDIDDKIDILGALGNCGYNITVDLDQFVDKFQDIKKSDYTLIRIIGCYGNRNYMDFLLNKFSNKDPLLCEVIIYALGRLLKDKSIKYLIDWYKSEKNNLIKAAAIETISKYDTAFVNDDIINVPFDLDNPYLLSAIIRATEISKSERWKDFLPKLFNHSNILIKLCAARSASVLADSEYAMGLLSDDVDSMVKSVFDEKIYCRDPFRPEWLSRQYNFNIETARLRLRLTWPDQSVVFLQRNLDMARILSRYMSETGY